MHDTRGNATTETLVNRITQELAEARRTLASTTRRLGTASKSLEARTQELAEARAALTLLLATLDSTSDGLLALGYFGRAMHYNRRFVEMWDIPEDMLAALNEPALMAIQLSQVKDPERFLADAEARKRHPDAEHRSLIARTDGLVYECHVVPHRFGTKRVGLGIRFQDVTEREQLLRRVAELEPTS